MSALTIVVLYVLIIFIERKNMRNPFFIISSWWIILLFLSNINNNLYISNETNLFFIVNILFFYFSTILFRRKKIVFFRKVEQFDFIKYLNKLDRIKYLFSIVNISVAFMLNSYLNTKNISRQFYRDLLFKNPNLLNEILGPIFRQIFFYSNIFFLLYLSVGIYKLLNKKKSSSIYFINLILLDYINGSRSYTLLLVIVILSFLYFNHVNLKKILFFLILGLGLGLLMSLGRMGEMSLYQIIKVNIVDYHSAPFALFSLDFSDKSSYLYKKSSYGLSSLGLIGTAIAGIFDFNAPIDYQNKLTEYMLVFRNVGIEKPFNTNAFYTIFYNFVLDGGVLFSLINVIIYGFLLSQSWIKYEINKSSHELVEFYIIFILGIVSIYFSITYTYYWLLFILFLLIKCMEFITGLKNIVLRRNF